MWLNLSLYEYDIDDNISSLNWSFNGFNTSLVNYSFNYVTKRLNITPVANANGNNTVRFTLTDDEGGAHNQYVLINVTPVNDAPSNASISSPVRWSTVGGAITVTWVAATDIDGDDLNYTLEYTDNSTPYNMIETIIGRTNVSYSWNSSINISGVSNVSIRINVSDGIETNSTIYTNFTVDNLPPGITQITQDNIVVGSSVGMNHTTDENANCIFAINGSATVSPASTSNTTIHWTNVSGMSYNTTYQLDINCTDSVANLNTSSASFSAWDNGLIFVDAYANQTLVVLNNPVNLTMDILSRNPVTTLTVGITLPNTSVEYFTVGEFSPQINSTVRLTYKNGTATNLPTNLVGNYTLTLIDIVAGGDQPSPNMPYVVGRIYETFAQVNQSLSLN